MFPNIGPTRLGARLDIRDTVHQGTPFDWAIYGERTVIADYFRAYSNP